MKSNYSKFLFAIVFVFPFLVGGYYIFTCTALGIILAVGLLINTLKNKSLKISRSYPAVVFSVITILYLISRFWAVDSSMATEGFLKYLCIFLFVVSLWQIDMDDRVKLLDAVVLSAALMTVLALLLGLSPTLHLRFYDANEDLHGFFEYANAYAIFLLCAIIILILRKNEKVLEKILSAVFIVIFAYGIIASKARAVWILSVFVLVVICFSQICKKLDKKKIIILLCVVAVLGAVFVAVLATLGYIEKIFNYLNTDSSLNERYLFYKDTILYCLKHPFGKGAFAFYYAQPQFQSAYYYAMDVHNDYLQLMIEIGIIPSVMFFVLIVLQLFSKGVSTIQKFVLFAIALHCAVDYDLQFASIFFILAVCIDYKNIKEVKLKNKFIPSLVAVILVAVNIIIGASNFLNYIGDHDKSVYFYKNTPSLLILMHSTNLQQAGYDYATEILSINNSVFEANNVLSRIYAENKDFDEAIRQMELVIEKDPREMQHYRDYIDLCVDAEEYYKNGGDEENAQICIDKLLSVQDKINELKNNTDERGIKYAREQDFDLGDEYYEIIRSFG